MDRGRREESAEEWVRVEAAEMVVVEVRAQADHLEVEDEAEVESAGGA